MSQITHKQWPFSVSRSTGEMNKGLLHALLATSNFDEISNADDFIAVHNYVKSQGRVDDSGKTTVGLTFWVYPTGLHGPYHETEDHQIKQHGVFLTAEPGVSVTQVVEAARARLEGDKILHEHISSD